MTELMLWRVTADGWINQRPRRVGDIVQLYPSAARYENVERWSEGEPEPDPTDPQEPTDPGEPTDPVEPDPTDPPAEDDALSFELVSPRPGVSIDPETGDIDIDHDLVDLTDGLDVRVRVVNARQTLSLLVRVRFPPIPESEPIPDPEPAPDPVAPVIEAAASIAAIDLGGGTFRIDLAEPVANGSPAPDIDLASLTLDGDDIRAQLDGASLTVDRIGAARTVEAIYTVSNAADTLISRAVAEIPADPDQIIGRPVFDTIPAVHLTVGEGPAFLDLRNHVTVPNGSVADISAWTATGAGVTVDQFGEVTIPTDAPRSNVAVQLTATAGGFVGHGQVRVNVGSTDAEDLTPPNQSNAYLTYDNETGAIVAGTDVDEESEHIAMAVPKESGHPTVEDFDNRVDATGTPALAHTRLGSAGPGPVRLPMSLGVDQPVDVFILSRDVHGNSSRMLVGDLDNRTLLADFAEPDGTALADYTADTGQQFTDIDSDLAISGGRLVNVNDQAGVVRRRSFRLPLSSSYGRLSAVIRLSDDENAGVSMGSAGFAVGVTGSAVYFRVYDEGASSPRDSTFETIQRSTPPLQDAFLEIDVRPDGHDTYLDGELIRSSDSDGGRDDRMAYFSMSHQGDSIGLITFDANHYRAEVDGSISRSNADQPQEPATLGFAARPTLDITGDAVSYDAGAPDWPADATGRTSNVTLSDEAGVLLETSGLDNPSGQTAAGTGLHTLTVTLNAEGYEPVTRSVSARRPGETALAMSSSSDGEYEAMVDDGSPYEVRDGQGNAVASGSTASGPVYGTDAGPVIGWTTGDGSAGGDVATIEQFPPVAYREDSGPLVKKVKWRSVSRDENLVDLTSFESSGATLTQVEGNTATISFNGNDRVQGQFYIPTTEVGRTYEVSLYLQGVNSGGRHTSVALSNSNDPLNDSFYSNDNWNFSHRFEGTGEPMWLGFDFSREQSSSFTYEITILPPVETKEEETSDPSHVFSYERADYEARYDITATYTPYERHGEVAETRTSNTIQTP